DVPSYLGRGALEGPEELHSYDHGAGHLIDGCRRAGALGSGGGQVVRLRMTRGARARVASRDQVPILGSEPIDRLMECLESNGVVHPVARLKPLGNLKN